MTRHAKAYKFKRTLLKNQELFCVNRPLVERQVERGGEREKRKGLWTDLWGRRSTAPAVHQILMQTPIGENTDC